VAEAGVAGRRLQRCSLRRSGCSPMVSMWWMCRRRCPGRSRPRRDRRGPAWEGRRGRALRVLVTSAGVLCWAWMRLARAVDCDAFSVCRVSAGRVESPDGCVDRAPVGRDCPVLLDVDVAVGGPREVVRGAEHGVEPDLVEGVGELVVEDGQRRGRWLTVDEGGVDEVGRPVDVRGAVPGLTTSRGEDQLLGVLRVLVDVLRTGEREVTDRIRGGVELTSENGTVTSAEKV
jgi:hypothetical protein